MFLVFLGKFESYLPIDYADIFLLGNGAKMLSDKRCILTPIYPTLIINPGTIFYLKSVLSLRRSLFKSNVCSIVLTKVNEC